MFCWTQNRDELVLKVLSIVTPYEASGIITVIKVDSKLINEEIDINIDKDLNLNQKMDKSRRAKETRKPIWI